MTNTNATAPQAASRPTPGRGGFAGLLQRSDAAKGYTLLMPTLLVMLITIVLPFAIFVVVSFWTPMGFEFNTDPTLNNYREVVDKPIYSTLYARSFWISGWATIATVVLSYPMAYYVAFHVHKNKMMWIVLMTLPFWTSYLLRVFAWKVILGYEGVINSGLLGLGWIDAPLEFLLYSPNAVVITLAHAWAAFAILPMYVSLEKIDKSLLEAATDLGDGPMARFFRVTFPLSLPGVIAACILVFIPTTGDYITPQLLGGPDGLMIGNFIQRMFGPINNWPMGATMSIVLMLLIATTALTFMALTWFVKRKIV